MDKILHDPKDPKLWELWYIPYYGSCRILSINRRAWAWAVLQMLGKAREQLQSGIGSPELDPNDQSLMLTALKPKP